MDYKEITIDIREGVFIVEVETEVEFHPGTMYDENMTGTPDSSELHWKFIKGVEILEDGTEVPLVRSHPHYDTVMSWLDRNVDY